MKEPMTSSERLQKNGRDTSVGMAYATVLMLVSSICFTLLAIWTRWHIQFALTAVVVLLVALLFGAVYREIDRKVRAAKVEEPTGPNPYDREDEDA